MIFLVDYENVGIEGLRGYSETKKDDEVHIFFSKNANKMNREIFNTFVINGCDIFISKLKTINKNALDFYIVSKLGELIGKNTEDNIAVISKDKGFNAAIEYWKSVRNNSAKILLANTLGEAISQRNEVLLSEESESIDALYNEYRRTQNIKNKIIDRFNGTKFEPCISEILEILEKENDKSGIYRKALHVFGRENGLKIYQTLKETNLYMM